MKRPVLILMFMCFASMLLNIAQTVALHEADAAMQQQIGFLHDHEAKLARVQVDMDALAVRCR